MLVDAKSWLCYNFIGIFVMGLTFGLDEIVKLAINKTVLTKSLIAISF